MTVIRIIVFQCFLLINFHLINSYSFQWQLLHSGSLVHFYQRMTSLLHTAICLIVRPSMLAMLISRSDANAAADNASCTLDEDELQRVRRIFTSASASADHEVETHNNSPQLTSVQNQLLDVISAGLATMRSLGPDLLELLSGDVADCAEFEPLLAIGFSSPTFEQEEVGLTYGTLVSVASVCIRAITRGDRSPSPSPTKTGSASAPPLRSAGSTAGMDRKRLILVLEQSLHVMLAQALLCLADARYSSRDQQLLKRELGAEMSSFSEGMRRYISRGSAKSPSTLAPASGSASPSKLEKSDEQFLNFVSNVVNSVFK